MIPSGEIHRDTWRQPPRRHSFHEHFFNCRGRSGPGPRRRVPSATTRNQRPRHRLMGFLVTSFYIHFSASCSTRLIPRGRRGLRTWRRMGSRPPQSGDRRLLASALGQSVRSRFRMRGRWERAVLTHGEREPRVLLHRRETACHNGERTGRKVLQARAPRTAERVSLE